LQSFLPRSGKKGFPLQSLARAKRLTQAGKIAGKKSTAKPKTGKGEDSPLGVVSRLRRVKSKAPALQLSKTRFHVRLPQPDSELPPGSREVIKTCTPLHSALGGKPRNFAAWFQATNVTVYC
jgi:hypothetical protein